VATAKPKNITSAEPANESVMVSFYPKINSGEIDIHYLEIEVIATRGRRKGQKIGRLILDKGETVTIPLSQFAFEETKDGD
jgi:hypothetical protein